MQVRYQLRHRPSVARRSGGDNSIRLVHGGAADQFARVGTGMPGQPVCGTQSNSSLSQFFGRL